MNLLFIILLILVGLLISGSIENYASVSVLRNMYLSDEPNYSTCNYLPVSGQQLNDPALKYTSTCCHCQNKFVYSDNPIKNYV